MKGLSSGLHSVEVKATFVGKYYHRGYHDGVPVWEENVAEVANSSGKIYFKVDVTNSSTIPSPEPIQDPTPSPSLSQESTLLQETQHSEPFPTVPVLAASAVAVIVVGAGWLVYLKKRGRSRNL